MGLKVRSDGVLLTDFSFLATGMEIESDWKETLKLRIVEGHRLSANLLALTFLDANCISTDESCTGVDGRDGVDGREGVDGRDGVDGREGVDGRDGVDGREGVDGRDGEAGVDGRFLSAEWALFGTN